MITEEKKEAEIKSEEVLPIEYEGKRYARGADIPVKIKCPNHPNNSETIYLQGDPHLRCAWCHTILD